MCRACGFLAACALLLAGCGGGSATDALSQTASNLGKIRSGTLHVELLVTPHGPSGASEFGFKLDGPFSLEGAGALPVARIAYTQLASGKSATVTILSTGRKGYVVVGGKTYALTSAQESQLRSAAAQIRSGGAVGSFPLDSWIEEPKLSGGGEVGGAETDRVQAKLDVVNASNGLLALVRGLGQNVKQLQGRNADDLAHAVRSSRFELWTGKKDRLLRRVEIEADLGFDVPEALRAALGTLVGAKISFRLGVDNPNEPVTVPEPANPLPASALPSG
jgi:hypothetical protein